MAVYTHISQQDLTQYLTGFDIGPLVSFAGITEGVENTNYRLVTGRGEFILTLFEKRTRPEDLPFCLGFMQHLHGKGIPCPAVICGKNGEKIVPFQGKPAVITTALPGRWPRQPEESHAAFVGTLLARIHLTGKDFNMRRENALSFPAWRELIALCGDKTDQVRPGLAALLQEELAYLEKNRPRSLPTGAIHADLFPDNVFFDKKTLSGVIDFYFSCTDVFAYDLMLTLNAWCFAPEGRMDAKKAAAFLKAYQQERPLLAAERTALPFYGRAAALRIISTRLHDWLYPVTGAVVQPKNPLDYVQILRFYQTQGFTP